MVRLYLLTLFTTVVAVFLFVHRMTDYGCLPIESTNPIPQEWFSINEHPLTQLQDRRPSDQTYLTFPEWFLVFSPEEQALYMNKRTSTTFPYMVHISQFWKSYSIVNKRISENYSFNLGYHFMIWVIGVSTTAEYFLKGWYENICGRITDTETTLSDEDCFASRYTDEYVKFIKVRPWYEFDYLRQLEILWTQVPFSGVETIRKWERRYILTTELCAKYLYSKLIMIGTRGIYDEALPTTTVVLSDDKQSKLPRYDQFKEAVSALGEQQKEIKEIAGNNSAILITILVSKDRDYTNPSTRVLFTHNLATQSETKRVALIVPIKELTDLVKVFNEKKIKIEHIFDF